MPGDEPRPGELPFVGRAGEIEQLCAGLDAVSAGRGALFMIVGEPGIGKTRLADEVAQRAAHREMQVLWGRCWESGGAPPYWPWVQILRACTRRLGAATLISRVRAVPDLAQILPELRTRVPDLPDTAPVESEQGSFRVLDAATQFLRAAAADQPLVLLLDDLHAADQSSLLLLRFVARELRSLPLLVIGTYRDVEAARDPLVSQILAAVGREGQAIPLRGLSAAAVASYIDRTAPRPIARATVDAVYAVTEGNPLFLTEVIRLWVAEQSRRGRENGTLGLSIPEELRATIRQRITPLPEPVRRVLSIAAVQGREFDAAVVERVAAPAVPAAAVHDALDQARAAGVAHRVGNAIGRFSFAHVLVRDVLYDDLRSTERAALHRALAESMEQMYAANLSPHLAEIAHHHGEAAVDGEVDKAVEFARRAGDRALFMLAYEDAVRHFERALHAFALQRRASRHADRALHCELLLALGDALWGAGDLSRMRETYQRAAEVARGMAAQEGAPRLARAALGFGGRQQRAHLVFDVEVVRLLEEARDALGEGDSPLRARILARLAYALYIRPGSHARRAQLSREAVDMARRIGDPGTLRRVLNDTRWALWGPDTIDERLSIAAELVRLADEVGDMEMALGEHAWRMVDLLELGDIAAFDAELDSYTRIARELRRPWFESYIGRFGALRALLQGRFADAERLSEGAAAAMERSPQEDATLIQGTQMLAIRTEQGRLAEVEAGVQAFAAQYQGVAIWRYFRAFLHAELERPGEARAEVERVAAGEVIDLPADYLRLAAGAYLTEACCFLGDSGRAALLYDILRPYAGRCVVLGFGVVCWGSVSRYLGMLAGTMGNADAAAAHFETALQTNARLGARPALARTQYAYAQLLIGRQRAGRPGPSATERERAAQLLREAYASALELGMQSLLSRVAALAARAGLQIDAQPQTVAADLPEAPLPGRLVCRFRREGEYWTLGCGDRIFRLQHLRGLTYIDQLLRRPGVDVHVFDLIDLADGVTMDRRGVQRRDEGDTGPLLDATARAALKTRLQELREELAEAEDANDLGRAERHREEIDQLAQHLAAATGLGGRDRGAGAQANRARVAVAKAIRVSLARIAEQSSDLAQHLDRAIKTGMFCCYVPDPLRPVAWELD